MLKEAHEEVRRSIFQLKQSGPPLAPLWERWAEHLRLFQKQTGIRVEMTGARRCRPTCRTGWSGSSPV